MVMKASHLGDILHTQNLQLIDPNVSTIFDVNSDTALAARKRLLEMFLIKTYAKVGIGCLLRLVTLNVMVLDLR